MPRNKQIGTEPAGFKRRNDVTHAAHQALRNNTCKLQPLLMPQICFSKFEYQTGLFAFTPSSARARESRNRKKERKKKTARKLKKRKQKKQNWCCKTWRWQSAAIVRVAGNIYSECIVNGWLKNCIRPARIGLHVD